MGALTIFIRGPICVLNAGRDLLRLAGITSFSLLDAFCVLALSLNAFAVGAPLGLGLRIRSPLPAFILARFL